MLFAAILAASARTAAAQIDPFPGTDMTISKSDLAKSDLAKSDLAVIEEIASGLIRGDVVPAGTKLDWYNGETHRRGAITVVGSAHREGRPCHTPRYTLPVRSNPPTPNDVLTWCKMADGAWKSVAR